MTLVVNDPFDVAHWCSSINHDDQPFDVRLTYAHTWCLMTRRFKRGDDHTYNGVPTCLYCIARALKYSP